MLTYTIHFCTVTCVQINKLLKKKVHFQPILLVLVIAG